ncbi:MAG: alpha/beta hydrolase [Acidobacteriota bacterium]
MKWMIRILTFCLALCPLIAIPVADAEAMLPLEGTHQLDSSGNRQDVGNLRPLPSGVRAEKVKFENNGVSLGGTLFIPKPIAGKRAPALLLISGSDHHRKGAVPIARAPLTAFSEIGALLAGNGIVAFNYDTRCNGTSDCKSESTPHDYASDAIAAYGYLSRRAEVDAAKILILGHDEGGCFAASVASNPAEGTQKAIGVVLIAVPGRTYGKVLREQAGKRLDQAGKTPAEIGAYLARFDALANSLASGSLDPKTSDIDVQDPLFGQFIANRAYLFHLFVNDPLQVVRSIETPVLIIQGEKDAHIGVRDAQYLKESLGRQYNENVTFELLPEMDHWMRASKGAVLLRDEEATGPLDPLLLTTLNGWIAKRLK